MGHSFSEKFFTQKFKQEKINAKYTLFEIDNIDKLACLLKTNKNLLGLNVTIPFKQTVIPLLDELSENAVEISAVNCIAVKRTRGRYFLKGYNTDFYGFSKSLRLTNRQFHNALILGTGGASKAVAFALKSIGVAYKFVSRTSKANSNFITYADLTKENISQYDLIVNCTPLGTYPNDATYPPIPYEGITKQHFLFDLVYNPSETSFLKKGFAMGAEGKNGLEMLHFQAEKAWEIFSELECEF